MKVICIAGPSGSGKSTTAEKLTEFYGKNKSLIISIDDYYKDLSHIDDVAERAKVNFDDLNSVDATLLLKHVQDLKLGLTIQAPQWDFVTHSRKTTTREIIPEGIEYIFIEGIFAMQLQLHKLSDVNVYVDTHHALCFLRRLERDVKERGRTHESVIAQYKATVLPMQLIYVEPSKKFADVVISNDKDDLSLDISPVIEYVDSIDEDEFTTLKKNLSAAKASVEGWFGSWKNYATQQAERADKAAEAFLMPEAQTPGGPK